MNGGPRVGRQFGKVNGKSILMLLPVDQIYLQS